MSSAIEFVSFLDQPQPYSVIWDFQKARVTDVACGARSETIIICEHESLLTLGRRSKRENILDRSLPTYEIERGGDVTLHSPGQLVVYLILKLNSGRFPGGLQDYLRFLEQILIDRLSLYGLQAGRFGPTGVWIKNSKDEIKKIASLGISVRRWVTYHGLAINISNDLSEFQKIRPCDFEANIMTSLKKEGVKVSLKEFAGEIKTDLVRELERRERDAVRGSAAVPLGC